MHSFGQTEHYMILVEFPLVINPFDILISGKPFAENLLWKPENGTKFTIVSRANGKVVRSYQSEPFFAFHHVNSFETENNGIVVDIVAYPDSTIVRSRWILLKAQRFSPCIFHTVSVMRSDTVGHIADLMGMIFNDGSYSRLSKYLISYAATHNLLEV